MAGSLEELYHEQIYRLATLDGLTQVYNQRYFQDALAQKVGEARRYRRPLGLVILDIDDFKGFNDAYGHWAGDLLLRELARLIEKNIRREDAFARVGGEEFALIAEECGPEGVMKIGEKLRRLVEGSTFDIAGQNLSITLSVGGAVLTPPDDDAEALYERADQALYRAKQEGRNLFRMSLRER